MGLKDNIHIRYVTIMLSPMPGHEVTGVGSRSAGRFCFHGASFWLEQAAACSVLTG